MSKQVKLSSLKCSPILETIGDIEVYNLNHKDNATMKEEVIQYASKKMKDIDSKTGNLDISGYEVLKYLIPLMTNIIVDEMTEEEIADTLLSPSDELKQAVGFIYKEFKNVIDEVIELSNTIANMSPEEKKIFNNKMNNMVQKEEEKTKRLNRLKEIEEERKNLLKEVENNAKL